MDSTVESRNGRAAAAHEATLAAPPAGAHLPAASRDDVPLATVDSTHYELERELARGGMGRIHLARDRRLGRIVAIKEVLLRDGELARRFEREARITARLQHPSIVSVYEAGLWPSGFPFYAMPRVHGRSLDEVVAEATTLGQRLALVPNVLAVADAIAYAHGESVIHRDLKPKNVLVGTFGETVVIDWGLAKDLNVATAEPAGPYRTAAGGLETEVGEVMGTPAYMPPEQAAGDAVDQRADVYAIGALLLHVLTGRPPYEGRTAVAVLDAVRHGPPVSVREREPDVPVDLAAIVERAMARDAADRYPTARELAADLRRYQTGQLVGAHRYSLGQLVRRWIARHRAPIAVGVSALVILAILGVVSVQRIISERQRANAQRDVAEINRSRADELTDFMLVDMRAKLEPVGKLDLLDVVARKAASYYDTRTDLDLGRRATALENIGDVLAAKGDIHAAHARFSSAHGLRAAAAFLLPHDEPTQQALVTTLVKLGDVTQHQGNGAAAALLYERAFALAEPRAHLPAWQRLLLDLHRRLAEVQYARADSAAARARLESAIALAKGMDVAAPGDIALVRDQATLESRLASLLLDSDITASIAHRRAGLVLLETAGARRPDDIGILAEVAQETRLLGDALEIGGDPNAQLAAYRAALVLAERLVAHDPTNARWKLDLAETHARVGGAFAAQRAPAAALDALARGTQIASAVVDRDTSNIAALTVLSSLHERSGNVHRNSALGVYAVSPQTKAGAEQARKAITEYRRAIELHARIVELDRANRTALRDLALVHEQLGHALSLVDEHDAALAELHLALTVGEQLVALDPSNLWWRADIGHVHLNLGSMLRSRGDHEGALAELRKALAIQQDLGRRDPANVEWQREIVTTHMFMGNAYYDRRVDRADLLAALAEYTVALDITRRLAAAAPDDQQTAAGVRFIENRVALARKRLATGDLD